MKRIFSLLTVFGLITLVSCEENNGPEKDFDFSASKTAVLAGETVTFTDYTTNVQSRTWTFPDGTPATSTASTVDVVFNETGTKDVTLEVAYTDGTSQSGTLQIHVLEPMSADIAVSGLTERGCAKKGTEITFSLENVVGEPTGYEWTFPGATPETSTEASPKVVWNTQINNVEVTCKLTRSLDGAEFTTTTSFIAGNYPLIGPDTEYGVDVYGFEQGEGNKAWYNWGKFPTETGSAGEHPDIMTIVDGGANGTAKCMKLDISQEMGQSIWEFAHRNNWSNNARLTVGQTYELSLWFRTDADIAQSQMAACFWLNIFSYVPDYLNDPLRGLKASDYWSTVFPEETFEPTSQIPLWAGAITTAEGTLEAPVFNNLLTNEWTQYTFEFTLGEDFGAAGTVYKNCYLAFGITGLGAAVYLDEVQLNLVE